ncbi:type III pantothenate kinase [Pusillimonas noertemannii]|uniref:Type III pantothenate kinase n=1 Tax=Pusillimonas noertemannii TaxID=305977 RepID=A0A2U1CIN1_9BURK|nr:type III pantothenate kinase [Pusillimonas noertemannii]NYT70694.1 type III pantothenate kinase [Pusillimonas noertemannii]PVY60851.1 type III pantothenate kinase [Pusillimonas noertemannii]TFL08551.1 type III pantothenate kinase [Pusillimonas noertemannii]
MILLVDAGNTRIKLDWMEAGNEGRAGRSIAFALAEIDAARDWLDALPRRPSRALGVNVAGEAVAVELDSLLGQPVRWVKAGAQGLGVLNGYREPAQLGADRWAAMLGLAWHERRRRAAAGHAGGRADVPDSHSAAAGQAGSAKDLDTRACALLAIFGTATTIDTLCPAAAAAGSGAGGEVGFEFPGGLILPGPAMMLSSLSSGTANLPLARAETALYPTHTHQAIATGVAAAQAGAVLRQWLAGLEQCGQPPELYVSGGGWPAVRDETLRLLARACAGLGLAEQAVHWLDAPVLDGLACLASQAEE